MTAWGYICNYSRPRIQGLVHNMMIHVCLKMISFRLYFVHVQTLHVCVETIVYIHMNLTGECYLEIYFCNDTRYMLTLSHLHKTVWFVLLLLLLFCLLCRVSWLRHDQHFLIRKPCYISVCTGLINWICRIKVKLLSQGQRSVCELIHIYIMLECWHIFK